jgi:hypothetical protein
LLDNISFNTNRLREPADFQTGFRALFAHRDRVITNGRPPVLPVFDICGSRPVLFFFILPEKALKGRGA